jgi:integrase
MTVNRRRLPRYKTVTIHGDTYYRTYVETAEGKKVALYGKSREVLYEKEQAALDHIDSILLGKKSPTVKEYCEKWLIMQSVQVRPTTLIDYQSKVRRHIISQLGDKKMTDVTLDDIQLAMISVSDKSASVYKSVVVLYKQIFQSAYHSKIIDKNPTLYLTAKGGGVPQKERIPLTDEQCEKLLNAVKDRESTYMFVMLGLYAGLRREEILALQWDCVFLNPDAPYLSVQRAWHTENNHPVITDELKTTASRRNIPLPDCLLECLLKVKEHSTSDFVIANDKGEPLTYGQFKLLWKYIDTRTAGEKHYFKYENGVRVKHTFEAKLGEKAGHNGHVVYSLDFKVTAHQLRHTYITNLIHAGVDPKTVQYLAGHSRSKITMDIYAKVKYHQPDQVINQLQDAFDEWEDED